MRTSSVFARLLALTVLAACTQYWGVFPLEIATTTPARVYLIPLETAQQNHWDTASDEALRKAAGDQHREGGDIQFKKHYVGVSPMRAATSKKTYMVVAINEKGVCIQILKPDITPSVVLGGSCS
jgi:hypothetical protein